MNNINPLPNKLECSDDFIEEIFESLKDLQIKTRRTYISFPMIWFLLGSRHHIAKNEAKEILKFFVDRNMVEFLAYKGIKVKRGE